MEESHGWLNWKEYSNIPLHALRYSVCKRLSNFLDADVPIFKGIAPNFGGLAELVGFDGIAIKAMERARSPTEQLFDDWKSRTDLNPTIGRLIELLIILEREDVLTDCWKQIESEAKDFLERTQKFDMVKPAPIQDDTVSPGQGDYEDSCPITIHDVMNQTETHYDAFICYNPLGNSSPDLEFVRELIKRFEAPPYKYQLFVPYRDDLVGLNAHTINAKIISERCRHMIVVLSPNFLESPACEFQSTFAHALSPSARNKRIVPVKIQDCPTPNILRIMACCDFTKKDLLEWSWERLAKSIMVPLSVEDFQVVGTSYMDKLNQYNNLELGSFESGVGRSISYSPVSSRSTSPSRGQAQKPAEPMLTRPPNILQAATLEVCSNSTVPVVSKKSNVTNSTGPLQRLKDHFTEKKPKKK